MTPDIKKLLQKASINEHDILAITPIAEGLSQECLLAETPQANYVIKRFDNLSGFRTEHIILSALKNSDIAPKLKSKLTLSNGGLVLMEHISGNSLKQASYGQLTKLESAAKLLAKFHSALSDISNSNIKTLDLEMVLLDLLLAANLAVEKASQVSNLISATLEKLNELGAEKLPKVFCHGDFNFTNIIDSSPAKIIDFESASLMPVEYDIAMMFAINECSLENLDKVTQTYRENLKQKGSSINAGIVKQYYIASILINGLWFLSKASHNGNAGKFNALAKAQFNLSSNTKSLFQ